MASLTEIHRQHWCSSAPRALEHWRVRTRARALAIACMRLGVCDRPCSEGMRAPLGCGSRWNAAAGPPPLERGTQRHAPGPSTPVSDPLCPRCASRLGCRAVRSPTRRVPFTAKADALTIKATVGPSSQTPRHSPSLPVRPPPWSRLLLPSPPQTNASSSYPRTYWSRRRRLFTNPSQALIGAELAATAVPACRHRASYRRSSARLQPLHPPK
jgi:hypothetical protein